MVEFVEEDPPGAPEWIVTFSDMISLLVTFFVLLLTFSSTSVLPVPSSDTKTPIGLFESTAKAVAARQIELMTRDQTDYALGSIAPHARPPEELLQSVVDMGRKLRPGELPLDVLSGGATWRLRFQPEAAFPAGSSEPSPALRKSLAGVAEALRAYDVEVVVEGAADRAFKATDERPERADLALARALAMANALAEAGLKPGRISCSTHRVAVVDGRTTRLDNEVLELRIIPRGKG
jgi:chemotaxis protein MotB